MRMFQNQAQKIVIKLPQVQWFKTRHIYFLTVLNVRSRKSRSILSGSFRGKKLFSCVFLVSRGFPFLLSSHPLAHVNNTPPLPLVSCLPPKSTLDMTQHIPQSWIISASQHPESDHALIVPFTMEGNIFTSSRNKTQMSLGIVQPTASGKSKQPRAPQDYSTAQS